MVVYPGGKGQPLKATYWDNEDHTIHYVVNPSADGKTLTFVSEPNPAGPRFRLTYSRKGVDEVGVAFAIAPPGKPEEFRTYTEGSARRKPRSQVGAAGSLPRGYVAYRAREPITIDGKLDDEAWEAVPWTEAFVDIEGDRKPGPRFRDPRQDALGRQVLLHRRPARGAARLGHPHQARLGHLPGQRLRGLHRPRRRQPRVLRVRDQRPQHRLGPVPEEALSRRRPGPQRLGDPRAEDGRPRRRHAQRLRATPTRPGRSRSPFPWKVLAEYAHRPAPPRDGDQWRVNFSRVEWRARRSTARQVPQGARHARGQLGLVAPGRRRHAPPRALGLRAVLDRRAGHGSSTVPTPPARYATA